MLKITKDRFLILSGICALLSALTTLVVHLIKFPSATFEDKILLYQNAAYKWQNIVILLHCVLVVISLTGFAIKYHPKSKGWMFLGLLCFVIFAITEIYRTTITLTYVNNLRELYAEGDEFIQRSIHIQLELWSKISWAQFYIFIAAFGMGNLFYGIGLQNYEKPEKILGLLFIVWAIFNAVAFSESFLNIPLLSSIVEKLSSTFQPAMRILIAGYLLTRNP